ncbi:MAG: lipoprotein [Wujia sp.]
MRRKMMYLLCLAMLGGLAGCGQKEETTTEATTQVTTEATTEATTQATTQETTEATPMDAEEELQVIGTKTADTTNIKVENKTNKNIVGITVIDTASGTTSDNLLAQGDVYQADEKRYLCFELPAEGGPCDLELTFEDGTTTKLHGFAYARMETVQIYLEDTVGYVMYEDTTEKKMENTYQAEMEKKAADEAAAQAAAEAAAAEAAAAQAPAPADDDDCLGDGLTY